MKNILIIAYYYPPIGGAGVQRTSKFAKYLCKLGYNVHVLTVNENVDDIIDETLKNDIIDGIKVHRTPIDEYKTLGKIKKIFNKQAEENTRKTNDTNKATNNTIKKFLKNIKNLMFLPDDKKGWIKYALPKAEKIIKENDIDIIYTTSYPYSAHIIGDKLKKCLDVKWIADFRDPWVSNSIHQSNYSFLLKKIYSYFEKKIITNADKVISVSEPIIEDFINTYKHLDKDKFVCITNGYDEADFENYKCNLGHHNENFTIVYNGTIYDNYPIEKVLLSIEKLIKEEKIKNVKLKLTGIIVPSKLPIINYYSDKYPNTIEIRSYINHKESIEELAKANALLLIIAPETAKEIYTGKIFEYIRSQKPIIGIVPDGVARELIIRTGTGYLAYSKESKEIEEAIYKAYCSYKNKNVDFHPNWDEIEKYSRENLSKKLLDIVN